MYIEQIAAEKWGWIFEMAMAAWVGCKRLWALASSPEEFLCSCILANRFCANISVVRTGLANSLCGNNCAARNVQKGPDAIFAR